MITRNKPTNLKAIQFLGSPYPVKKNKGQAKNKKTKQAKLYEKRKND